MLDIGEIRDEIKRLENGDTTYSSVEKLAMLYTVQDHQQMEEPQPRYMPNYSYSPTSSVTHSSEFLEALNDKPMDLVLDVLEEHFEAVKCVFPKEYNAVINKIKAL